MSARVEYFVILLFAKNVHCMRIKLTWQGILPLQLFNQINARKINDELNVFSGIIHSHLFIYIWILEAGLQVRGPLFCLAMTLSQASLPPSTADASVRLHGSRLH
jgi:hypothetical protein